LGVGRYGPDQRQNVYLPNGCKVPVGPIIEIDKDEKGKRNYLFDYNEYVVYNTSQVRIKYVIEVM